MKVHAVPVAARQTDMIPRAAVQPGRCVRHVLEIGRPDLILISQPRRRRGIIGCFQPRPPRPRHRFIGRIGMSGFSLSSEPFTLERDCAAVMVPQGESVQLPAGQIGYITQALGGSFTVYVEGNLFRIAGADADALGKEPPPPIELAIDASDADVEKLVWQQLRTVFDPEIPINVVELGLVYDVSIEATEGGARKVYVKLTLTAPGCGMGDILVDDVSTKLEMIPTVVDADVDLVFDPPWNHSMMSDAAKLETGML
jgi:probable FeS assembly SUF system protein SufT